MAVPKWRKRVGEIFENVGIDWIFALANNKCFFAYFDIAPLNPIIDTTDEEKSKTRMLIEAADDSVLDEIIRRYESKLAHEDARGNSIESKANNLQGFTALTASFIIGFAQFLNNNSSNIHWVMIVFYVLVAVSMLMIILLAQQVVRITSFTHPKVEEWLTLRSTNIAFKKRSHILNLFISVDMNKKQVARKATYLDGAQRWFRNTIFLLLGFLAILVFSVSQPQSSVSNKPFEVIVVTVTPTFTPTATPTLTPTATLTLTPTLTATSIPAATSTQPPLTITIPNMVTPVSNTAP